MAVKYGVEAVWETEAVALCGGADLSLLSSQQLSEESAARGPTLLS